MFVLGLFESFFAGIEDLDVKLGGFPFVGDGAKDTGDGCLGIIFADA